jgi:hypothetical protein
MSDDDFDDDLSPDRDQPDDPVPDDDGPVGYRRPPKRTQFRKGQSGNPRGRPPRRVLHQVIEDALNEEVTVNKDGEQVEMTKKEVIVQKLLSDSMKGKSTATKNIILLLRVLTEIPPF